MVKTWKRLIAGAMALTILGGVGQIPTAYASGDVPIPSQIVPGEVRKNFTVPNSINVLVKDEDGAQVSGGEFQLIAEDGTVVKRWRGGNGISSANPVYYVDEEVCSLRSTDCYETGDYNGPIRFPNGIFMDRDVWFRHEYGDTVKYVSYGAKMPGEETVTIPAGEVWINVSGGYKREAGQEKITQIAVYGDKKYDLSDLAGDITKLQWPAGTAHEGIIYLRESSSIVHTPNGLKLTAASTAEEYRKITLDLHACYPKYVNEKGQRAWANRGVSTYGAPIVKGDYITSAYLQVTSGAVTNFISMANGPTAEIYVKKGDYEPQVACGFAGVRDDDGNRGNLFICGYMKHVLSVTAPPKEGMTIGYIPAGTYTLHQVSAAEGYLTAADQKITVKDSTRLEDLQKIEIVNQKEKPHEHTFSKDWSTDEMNHWHAATCEHGDLVKDKAAHTFGDWTVTVQPTEDKEGLQERSCTVCGATQQVVVEKLPGVTPKPETPPTGDHSHLGLWATAALAAGAGVIGIVCYQRKKRS